MVNIGVYLKEQINTNLLPGSHGHLMRIENVFETFRKRMLRSDVTNVVMRFENVSAKTYYRKRIRYTFSETF